MYNPDLSPEDLQNLADELRDTGEILDEKSMLWDRELLK